MLWIFAKGFCLGYDHDTCIFVKKVLDCLFYDFAVALLCLLRMLLIVVYEPVHLFPPLEWEKDSDV